MSFRKVYTILFIIGISIIFLGVITGIKDVSFLFNSSTTQGKILSLLTTQQQRSDYSNPGKKINVNKNSALVSFNLNNEKEIKFYENISILNNLFSKGQMVQILYDKKNPYNAHIKTYYPFLLLPGILIGFGIFWLLCLIPSYRFSKKKINPK